MRKIIAACSLVLIASPVARVVAETEAKPALVVTTLDGGTFDLSKQGGKWTIVNFWATWCSPCIKELPDISEFDEKHADVTAIGLAYEDTDKAEIVAFLKKHPVIYPIAQVDVYDPPKAFPTPRGLPMTYLIAPDGTIAKKFTGPITTDVLEKAIADARANGKAG
jgi:thiol-disulfide isomerase/thioredoxin